MEIIDNFCEIQACENLHEIDKFFFNSNTLEMNEFEDKIKTEFLEEEDKLLLDNFLSKILKKYPIYYPSIVIIKEKNHKRRAIQTNINDDIKSIKSIIEINTEQIKNIHLSRDEIFLEKKETLKFIKDEDLANLYTKINNEIFNQVSYFEVYKEIEELVKKEFIDILVDSERIKNLAKFITAEIYLRTKIPEEYIFTDDFIEIIEKHRNILKYNENKIENKIDQYFRNEEKNPQNLLEELKII
ncbi:MAG: hypothetical protein RBS32_11295 [Aliarcobacter sp.]|jgi:hypothetical protein|nr:hypothetical protein [Aliarcobacter sp.]